MKLSLAESSLIEAVDHPSLYWDTLRVAVIQTNLNAADYWKNGPPLEPGGVKRAKEILRCGFQMLNSGFPDKPHIVLLPEISVPHGLVPELKRFSESMKCIIIAGLDWKIDRAAHRASNQAVVFYPTDMRPNRYSRSLRRYVGKNQEAESERTVLARGPGYSFQPDSTVHVFHSNFVGDFGVAVCLDFLDLERALMYRGRIHHLFVLAYNKDLRSFSHQAESLCRTVFCNVVIANTGVFGGSVAVSPKFRDYKRMVYHIEGNDLMAAQIFEVSLAGIHGAQQRAGNASPGPKVPQEPEWKPLPPNYVRFG